MATPAPLPVHGVTTPPPVGVPFVVYSAGITITDTARINGEVEIAYDNGQKYVGTIHGMTVAPLIDLICGSSMSTNIYTYGEISTPLTLVQSMTDAGGGEVLDTTEYYTQLLVQMPMPPI
jgi:hypothetical protein